MPQIITPRDQLAIDLRDGFDNKLKSHQIAKQIMEFNWRLTDQASRRTIMTNQRQVINRYIIETMRKYQLGILTSQLDDYWSVCFEYQAHLNDLWQQQNNPPNPDYWNFHQSSTNLIILDGSKAQFVLSYFVTLLQFEQTVRRQFCHEPVSDLEAQQTIAKLCQTRFKINVKRHLIINRFEYHLKINLQTHHNLKTVLLDAYQALLQDLYRFKIMVKPSQQKAYEQWYHEFSIHYKNVILHKFLHLDNWWNRVPGYLHSRRQILEQYVNHQPLRRRTTVAYIELFWPLFDAGDELTKLL